MDKEKKKAYEIVVEKIEKSFSKGKLAAGDKLPSERELAERLKVSRTSVREGLRQLEQRGDIEIKHGKGSFVKTSQATSLTKELSGTILAIEDQFIYEMLEFRYALEIEAAYLAAQRATSEDLEKIKASLEKMTASKENAEMGIQADVAFHIAIVEATHNSVFIRLIKTLGKHMEDTIRVTRRHRLADPLHDKDTFDEHKEIYLAIATKDKDMAKELMKKHIIQIRRELSESMLKGDREGFKELYKKTFIE